MNIICQPANNVFDFHEHTLKQSGKSMIHSVTSFRSDTLDMEAAKHIQANSKGKKLCLWITQAKSLYDPDNGEYERVARQLEIATRELNIKYVMYDYEIDTMPMDKYWATKESRILVKERNRLLSLWPDAILYGSSYQGYATKPEAYQSPYFIGYENVKNFSPHMYFPTWPDSHRRTIEATQRFLGTNIIPFISIYSGVLSGEYKSNRYNHENGQYKWEDDSESPLPEFDYPVKCTSDTAQLLVDNDITTCIAYSVPAFKKGESLPYEQHLNEFLEIVD